MTPAGLIPYLDLTTLGETDGPGEVEALARQAVRPVPGNDSIRCAAVCTWANLAAPVITEIQRTGVKFACVAGGFPHGQAPVEIKVAEIQAALHAGADEIDAVINRGLLLHEDTKGLKSELDAMRQATGTTPLKIIIETCDIRDPELIKLACTLALESGADFLKTSTGKGKYGATPQDAEILFQVASEWHQHTGKEVGVKVSGGIRTWEQAHEYVTLAKTYFADVTPDNFRVGASSLLNDLLAKA